MTKTALATPDRNGPDPVHEQLAALFTSCGIPLATGTARAGAIGVAVRPNGHGGATVEWFAAPATRSVAADEQRDGRADGPLTTLHAMARTRMHQALTDLMTDMGFVVEPVGPGLTVVRGPRTPDSRLRRLGDDLQGGRLSPVRTAMPFDYLDEPDLQAPPQPRGFLIDEDTND
ncbi:hypothetical protein [Streptomyces sp. cg36]|uniref:hypothetical protein n=1 Tax=Streptomyces sp. cg36 TaxID=3238798 RepID=UPI0034E2205A